MHLRCFWFGFEFDSLARQNELTAEGFYFVGNEAQAFVIGLIFNKTMSAQRVL